MPVWKWSTVTIDRDSRQQQGALYKDSGGGLRVNIHIQIVRQSARQISRRETVANTFMQNKPNFYSSGASLMQYWFGLLIKQHPTQRNVTYSAHSKNVTHHSMSDFWTGQGFLHHASFPGKNFSTRSPRWSSQERCRFTSRRWTVKLCRVARRMASNWRTDLGAREAKHMGWQI